MAKKEKITYIDDGRTIADMSGVSGGFRNYRRNPYAPRSSLKEQMKTFWNAMKLMLLPTLVASAGLGLIFLIMYVVFSAA